MLMGELSGEMRGRADRIGFPLIAVGTLLQIVGTVLA
jgi:hypothetical protein